MNPTKFPHATSYVTGQAATDPLRLDGQRVLFDKKVSLLPADLDGINNHEK